MVFYLEEDRLSGSPSSLQVEDHSPLSQSAALTQSRAIIRPERHEGSMKGKEGRELGKMRKYLSAKECHRDEKQKAYRIHADRVHRRGGLGWINDNVHRLSSRTEHRQRSFTRISIGVRKRLEKGSYGVERCAVFLMGIHDSAKELVALSKCD